MARSIRLRLLGWYAAVLAGVVGGFAIILYYEVRGARLRDVDARLETAAAGLEAALRLFPPHELDNEFPPEPPHPRPGRREPPEKRPPPRGAFGPPHEERFEKGPPPRDGDVFPKGPPPPRERLWASLNPPPTPPGGAEPVYFAVWRRDGSVLKAEGLPPDAAPPRNPPSRPTAATRGPNREMASRGPAGTVLLVGCRIGKANDELVAFVWQLAGTGVAVLALGLTGVWVIARRIFRPVDAIAAAASRISAENLSERIDTVPLDAELVGLGRVLNDAFARLEASFERQARFTADASHELRTPLSVVRSRAELALSRPRGPEEYRDALAACLAAAERMSGLVERLLILARADAGWPGMKRAPVHLDRVVAEVIGQLASVAADKKVAVERDLVPARVTGDAEALTRVCVNLVTNAIQYNRPAGQVRVAIRVADGQVTLSVADTGIGIPEADRPRVFERFYRADKARSRASGGTGLGLSICKATVEAHGGTITFAANPEGGSTFLISLPGADNDVSQTHFP
jgi:heavy metal sensor kinase